MNPTEAINRLSKALELLNNDNYEKQEIASLTEEVADEQHKKYIDQGRESGTKTMIFHGLMGRISHYEAEIARRKIQALQED